MQRCAGRDHGVNRLFFLDKEVQQKRSRSGACFGNRADYFGPSAHRKPWNAVSVGKFDEVGADQRGGFVVAVIKELLPLTDHAEKTVVDDGDVDLELFLDDG